jgi:hypothetical protein
MKTVKVLLSLNSSKQTTSEGEETWTYGDPQNLRKRLALLDDLQRQLPRRRHDEGDRSVSRLELPLIVDVPQEGEKEGHGFSGPGLCDSDYVSAGHDGRDGLSLDRRWLLVAETLDDLEAVTIRGKNEC